MTAVDPRVVRQLATEHILDHARRGADVAADVMGHFGPGALERDAFDAWCEAIREAIKTATLIVGWDPQPTADDPVALLRTQLDTRRRTTVVPGQPLPPVVVVSETALRTALNELEQLRTGATVQWGLNVPSYYLPGHKDTVTPYPNEAVVREHAAIARRSGDVANVLRRSIGPWQLVDGDALSSGDIAEGAICECGCQPGRPCGCGLQDCECIGDCPVCDAEGATHVLSAGAG